MIGSPEIELLMCATGWSGDEERISRARIALQFGLDWERLLSLAEHHLTTSRLFLWLRDSGVDLSAHRPGYERLRQAYVYDTARGLRLVDELLHVLGMLEKESVPAMTFKGPVLALQAYGDLSARRFRDLDILVEPAHLRRAKEILLLDGYTWQNHVPPAAEDAYTRSGWEYILVHNARRSHVDLGHTIGTRQFAFDLDMGSIRERAVPVILQDRTLSTPAVEDLLLCLCAHGCKHVWSHLSWVADIAGLLRRQAALDWRRVLDRARESGGTRMLLTGLDLAHRIAGTPLSDAVTAAVRADRTAARLAEEARTAFISPDPDAMRQATIAGFHLAARERLRDRCRYVLRMIFTPTYSDWWAFSFVKHARFLVYVLRPFRLLGVLFSRGRRFTSRPGMT